MCFLIYFFTEYCLVAAPLKIKNIKKAIITTIIYLLQNKKVKARIQYIIDYFKVLLNDMSFLHFNVGEKNWD